MLYQHNIYVLIHTQDDELCRLSVEGRPQNTFTIAYEQLRQAWEHQRPPHQQFRDRLFKGYITFEGPNREVRGG